MNERLECAWFAYLPGGCVVGGLLAVWWRKWWEATLEGCVGALCKGLHVGGGVWTRFCWKWRTMRLQDVICSSL